METKREQNDYDPPVSWKDYKKEMVNLHPQNKLDLIREFICTFLFPDWKDKFAIVDRDGTFLAVTIQSNDIKSLLQNLFSIRSKGKGFFDPGCHPYVQTTEVEKCFKIRAEDAKIKLSCSWQHNNGRNWDTAWFLRTNMTVHVSCGRGYYLEFDVNLEDGNKFNNLMRRFSEFPKIDMTGKHFYEAQAKINAFSAKDNVYKDQVDFASKIYPWKEGIPVQPADPNKRSFIKLEQNKHFPEYF